MSSDSPILSGEETARLRAELAHLVIAGNGSEDGARADEIYHALVKSEMATQEALAAHYERMASLRAARRAAGIPPGYERVVDHIDGDPYNNDLDNLKVVDLRDNRGPELTSSPP